MRNCDKCIYSTRSGGCSLWSCDYKTPTMLRNSILEEVQLRAKNLCIKLIDEENTDLIGMVDFNEYIHQELEDMKGDEE